MCNAQIIAEAIKTGIGSAFSVGSGYVQYNAIEQEEKANADISKANEQLARSAEADARTRGLAAEGAARVRGAEMESEQRVSYAASGVDVNSGSPLDVLANTSAMTELDAQSVRANASREAWGFQVLQQQLQTQRKLDKLKAENAKVSTILGTVGGALGASSGLSSSIVDNAFKK